MDNSEICAVCGGVYGLHNHMNKACPKDINADRNHTEYRRTVFTKRQKNAEPIWPEELRKQFKDETGNEPIIFPVTHGENGYASWEYQTWLEEKLTRTTPQPLIMEGQWKDVTAIAFAEWTEREDYTLVFETNLWGQIGNKNNYTTEQLYKLFKSKSCKANTN